MPDARLSSMSLERVSSAVPLPKSNEPPSRIQIQDVRPQVDCGRYPVKACVGDAVTVSATVFRDGHEMLEAVVRYRPVGERRWREQRLEALGNDGFEATLRPDALGPWELRVEAWVDPYG